MGEPNHAEHPVPFAQLVTVSDAVAAEPSRGGKVTLLADLLKRVPPAQVPIAVDPLTGALPAALGVGPARPVGVAHITSVRPRIEVIGSCRYSDFEYLWSMALTGYLCHAYISFSKPHYGASKVFSMSFSREAEE